MILYPKKAPIIENDKSFQDESFVIATIYDIGLISLQLIIAIELKKLPEIPDKNPNNIEFSKAYLYPLKERYLRNDFFKRDLYENISLKELTQHYESTLSLLCGNNLKVDEAWHVCWGIGDFNLRSQNSPSRFIEDNFKLANSYLFSIEKAVINDYYDDTLKNNLIKTQVFKRKNLEFHCSSSAGFFVVGGKNLLKMVDHEFSAAQSIPEDKDLYQQLIFQKCKTISLTSISAITRFYELAVIKKFFADNIIKGIANEKYNDLESYQQLRKELDFLKLNFDEMCYCPAMEVQKSYMPIY